MAGDVGPGDRTGPEGRGLPTRRLPTRPVSRPPRLRPSTTPGSRRGGGPGSVLRSLSGALLAVAAVSLGIVVLLALRGSGGGDDTLLTTGDAAAGAPGSGSPSRTASATAVPAPGPAPAAPAPGTPPPPPPPPAPPAPPVPADVTVTVLGVGGSEAAETTAERLRAEGWTVRLVARYRGDPPGSTTLFHVPGREDAAALLAGSTGAALRPAPASLSESDLTLVVAG